MKSILKKVAGVVIAAVLALGIAGCSSDSDSNSSVALLLGASGSGSKRETVATPAFSVASGEVASGTSVTITCTTEGAKIYYTTDGSEPTAASTEYTAAISVTEAVTIKAIAVKDGMNDSAVASASYTIKGTVATPAFSVDAWVVESGTSVTITCTTEGAKIYYTTDGTAPTTASTEYTTAISVTEAVTLKAIAVKEGMNDSAVASASYTIKETVATPAFRVASGDIERGTSVTVTCATEGAKIYYTTDGSAPTAASTEYTAAISITEAVTIKAIAVKDGMNDSTVASASYKVIAPAQDGFVTVIGGTVKGAVYKDNYHGVFYVGRTVTLSSFYMGKYEVTQAQYKSVMEGQKVTVGGTEYTLADSPSLCVQGSTSYKIDSNKDHANYPVENVTWFDAVYYCNTLSAKENLDPCYTITVTTVGSDSDSDGHITAATVEYDKTKNGYRLPTNAEWEYAARGGDPTAADWNYTFSGANKAEGTSCTASKNAGLDSVGWYGYNNITGTTGETKVTYSADGRGTHEVGQKAANRLGIYDMSGNVAEWCYDWYEFSTLSETVTDPTGASSGQCRVTHGGSWSYPASSASVSYVNDTTTSPDYQRETLGFRVVRNATTE